MDAEDRDRIMAANPADRSDLAVHNHQPGGPDHEVGATGTRDEDECNSAESRD
jgi:hypothetical protein